MTPVYVFVDVGCIECGEETDVRLFSSLEIAQVYREEQSRHQAETWQGQHRFDVYALTVDGPPASLVDGSYVGSPDAAT